MSRRRTVVPKTELGKKIANLLEINGITNISRFEKEAKLSNGQIKNIFKSGSARADVLDKILKHPQIEGTSSDVLFNNKGLAPEQKKSPEIQGRVHRAKLFFDIFSDLESEVESLKKEFNLLKEEIRQLKER